MAQQLIQVAGGSLEVKLDDRAEAPLMVNITLPTAEQVAVLVIDDNVDTLQLMQRYLSNSRYRFIGTSDPQEGLALAEQLVPAIIVLDVMLPGVDGWELLGRLREHPKTSAIPVIVCTILPQRPLALTLGAAEFIRKPVSQKTLLSALDRQVDRWLTVSR
jgi:CheY-like chemotaxis protein